MDCQFDDVPGRFGCNLGHQTEAYATQSANGDLGHLRHPSVLTFSAGRWRHPGGLGSRRSIAGFRRLLGIWDCGFWTPAREAALGRLRPENRYLLRTLEQDRQRLLPAGILTAPAPSPAVLTKITGIRIATPTRDKTSSITAAVMMPVAAVDRCIRSPRRLIMVRLTAVAVIVSPHSMAEL